MTRHRSGSTTLSSSRVAQLSVTQSTVGRRSFRGVGLPFSPSRGVAMLPDLAKPSSRSSCSSASLPLVSYTLLKVLVARSYPWRGRGKWQSRRNPYYLSLVHFPVVSGLTIAVVSVAVVLVIVVMVALAGRGKRLKCPDCGTVFNPPAMDNKRSGLGWTPPYMGIVKCPQCGESRPRRDYQKAPSSAAT